VLCLVGASVATAARIRGTAGPDRLQTVNGVRDLVGCGRSRDLATVDGLDRVGADCEVVTREVARDPYRNTDSEHETEVEPDSAAFGRTVVAVYQVGRVFEGGARNIGFAVSRDAGRTWARGFLPGLVPRSSDPVVAYDRKHGTWLAFSLVFGTKFSAVAVNRSVDGRRWSAPVFAVQTPEFGQDKEWAACDNWPQSPHYGTCYLSYSDVLADQVVAQVSTDGGSTWSAAATAPGLPGRDSIRGAFAPGVQPLVLPSGRALIPYYDQGKLSTLSSDDGGTTWTAQLGIAPAAYRSHANLRAAPLPTSAVSSDGRAYLAWADCSFRGAGCPANDIVYTSTVDGVSWAPPARIPTGTGDAELPGLDADPSRPGRLALTYYIFHGSSLDVRFVSSSNAGVKWTAPQLLNSRRVPMSGIARTSLGSMVGDYISTSFAGGRAVPVFVLATAPTTRLHEAAFATSIAVR
jgi:hypothetical protein